MASAIGPCTGPGALISILQPSATAFSHDSRNTPNSRLLSSPVANSQPYSTPSTPTGMPAADQIEHLRVAHAGIEAALEVGAAQFDRVKAGDAGGIERGRQRRGVDGPHMQRERPNFSVMFSGSVTGVGTAMETSAARWDRQPIDAGSNGRYWPGSKDVKPRSATSRL